MLEYASSLSRFIDAAAHPIALRRRERSAQRTDAINRPTLCRCLR
jgi:hypothetical protein